MLKALWDGGVQYVHILEKIRSSEMFWKHLSSTLAIEVKIDLSANNLNLSDAQCTSYRYFFKIHATKENMVPTIIFFYGRQVPVSGYGFGSLGT